MSGATLPQSWTAQPIASFARTSTGGTPSRTVAANFGGSIPWVKSGELGDGVVRATEEALTQAGLDSSSAKVFPRGTLCIALYGATVGKVGILDVDAATNQAVCGIFLPKDVDTRYLFYFLLSKRRALIEQGKGGAQSNISNAIVRETIVPLAPFPEQRRMVAKIEELFSDLDAGVAALERVRANLKRYRAAVLKAAVEGRLTEEWRTRNPVAPEDTAAKLLERILLGRRAKWEQDQLRKFKEAGKTPPKGWKEKYKPALAPQGGATNGAPKTWCRAGLAQVATFQNGRPFPSDQYTSDGIKLLRPGNLFADGSVRWTEKNTQCMPESWAAEHPDSIIGGCEIVMNLTAQSLKDEFLGRVCLTDGDERCLLNQRLARISTLSGIDRSFALVLLKSATFRRFVDGLNTGSLIQHMFTSQLDEFAFSLPPLAEQSAIVAEVDRRLSVADAAGQQVEHALQRAARLRQSILKRAFEGRLVAQDSADEPATKLLERTTAATNGHRAVIETNGTPRRDTPKRRSRARA